MDRTTSGPIANEANELERSAAPAGSKVRDLKKRRALPRDRAWVTLTEATTWAVDDDCKDQDQILIDSRQAIESNIEIWSNVHGPDWLLPHLDLLRKGKNAWPSQGSADSDAINASGLLNARVWLARTGEEPARAYDRVFAECQRIMNKVTDWENRSKPWYAALFTACGNDHASLLLGRKKHWLGGQLGTELEPIPAIYFALPVVHSISTFSPNELSPAVETETKLFERVFSRSGDKRPDYQEVMIKVDDARRIASAAGLHKTPPKQVREDHPTSEALALPPPLEGSLKRIAHAVEALKAKGVDFGILKQKERLARINEYMTTNGSRPVGLTTVREFFKQQPRGNS